MSHQPIHIRPDDRRLRLWLCPGCECASVAEAEEDGNAYPPCNCSCVEVEVFDPGAAGQAEADQYVEDWSAEHGIHSEEWHEQYCCHCRTSPCRCDDAYDDWKDRLMDPPPVWEEET